MTILEQVQLELGNTDTEEFSARLSPVEEGETVIGEIDPEDRALFALSSRLGQEADQLSEEMTTKSFRGKIEDSPVARHHALLKKSEVLEGLFWLSVMERHHLWAKPMDVSIRKGWKLVDCS